MTSTTIGTTLVLTLKMKFSRHMKNQTRMIYGECVSGAVINSAKKTWSRLAMNFTVRRVVRISIYESISVIMKVQINSVIRAIRGLARLR